MSLPLRRSLGAGAMVATLFGVLLMPTPELTDVSPPTEDPAMGPSPTGSDVPEEELERQCQDSLARLETKCRLAREVVEGRLTLLEAAAGFRDLYRERPESFWSNLRERYPGQSDTERYC